MPAGGGLERQRPKLGCSTKEEEGEKRRVLRALRIGNAEGKFVVSCDVFILVLYCVQPHSVTVENINEI